MKRLIASLSVFALFFNVVPLNVAEAANNNFSLEGFRLSANAAFDGSSQEGPGGFASGMASNSFYAEGMCIPYYADVTNNTGSESAFSTQIDFGHYNNNTNVIGYEALETMVYIGGAGVVNATNLNEFIFTNVDLSDLDSIPTESGNFDVDVVIEGPFDDDTDAALTATSRRGYYTVTLENVPDGETVILPFCARLSDQAGAYSNGNGANLHLGLTSGGGGNIPVATNQLLELPEITVIKNVLGGGPLTAANFTMQISEITNIIRLEASFPGAEGGTTTVVQPGTYSVGEIQDPQYTMTTSGSCSNIVLGLADPAQTATCTVTNTYIAPVVDHAFNVGKVIVGNPDPANITAANFQYTITIDGVETGPFSFEADGSVEIDIPVGSSYFITEVPDGNYTTTYFEDCGTAEVPEIMPADSPLNDGPECTITNTFNPTTLTVTKNLITDNGSTDTLDSFTFFIDGQEVNLDEAVAVAPGVHTVTEEWTDAHELNDTIESRYTVSYGLDCAADGTVDIAAGEDLTCEIVNDDRPATVTVTKLINGSGPLTLSSDFTMTVDGTNATTPTGVVVDGQLQFAGDESGTVVTLDAGAYSVSEFQEDNYFAFPTAGCTGTLIPGQAVTCTITNTYFPPLPNTGFVSVHKVIDGGQAAPEDFQFVVTENGVPGAPVNFDASGTNVIELPIGASYSIAEVDPTGLGYAVTDSGTCSGTVSLAGNPACTITNTVMTAPLTITKEIFDNDTATPDQFEYMVVDIGASTVIAQDFFEADGEVVIDIEVGTSVAVSELDPGSDWDVDAVGCEDVMDADGMECVITNDFIVVPPAPLDDIFPTLSCVDDLGNGMLNAHFGYNNTNGFEVFLEAGSFDNRMNGGGLVDQNAGQTSSFSIGENDDVFQVAFDGAIPLTWTLVAGDSNSITADSNSPSCTPVEPGTITIRKILVQDNGASDALSNFEFFIGSNEVSLDVANEVDPGTYTLSEEWDVAPEGVTEVSELYDVSFSPECPDGVVTIVGSEDVTCTITNNDIPPGTSGSGGGSGGSGNGRSDGDNPAPPNNDDAPEGEVLGDTDEQDPATDDEAATDEVVDEAEDEVTQAPDPIVAGDTDELPRTGLPAAGLLLVPSVLLFYVRRRQD